jgi:hypothetical protein
LTDDDDDSTKDDEFWNITGPGNITKQQALGCQCVSSYEKQHSKSIHSTDNASTMRSRHQRQLSWESSCVA